MRYFLDCEFIEDGRAIELISIGIVAEDGREYYAQSLEADLTRADAWVQAHVIPQLSHLAWCTREQIRQDLLAFIGPQDRPEFWGYCSAYDWVVFSQIFGRMVERPRHWPYFCCDIAQWALQLGIPPLPPKPEREHFALADARWNKLAWETLARYVAQRGRESRGT